jgi:hypothetical protein
MAFKDRREVIITPLEDYNPDIPYQKCATSVPVNITAKFFDKLMKRKNGDGFVHEVFLVHPEYSESVVRSESPIRTFFRQEQDIPADNTAFSGNFDIFPFHDENRLEHFVSEEMIPARDIAPGFDPSALIANQCCVLKLSSSEHSPQFELAVFKAQPEVFVRVPKPYKISGKISPFNAEMAFARYLMHDSSIGAVTLLGAAGTGKSTMAIHAAVELLLAGEFTSIEIYKSTNQASGQPPVAAVPGNADQKFADFRKPVETTLNKVLRDLSPRIKAVIGNGTPANGGKGKPGGKYEPQKSYGGLPIHILSPAFLRGEDFEKRCIILEEAQNFTSGLILLAGTRLGSQSRLFVVGDQRQVDNPRCDQTNNGLTDMMNRLKGCALYGQVELTVCLRKGVAKMFTDAYYNT